MRQITYNSRDKNSAYYAGPKLVPQLRAHNFTCLKLGCKKAGTK